MRLGPLRSVMLALVLVLVGAILVFLFRPSPGPKIQSLPNGIVPYKPSVIHRWIPPTWGWFWRLKESLLGRSKVIALNTTVFDCQGLSNDVLSALSLPQPDFSDTNGLQVWVMDDSELGALRRRLEQTP